jgi:hypothetical protein
MQYLGALRGAGLLVDAGGVSLGRADYELDAYLMKPGHVVASGEIRMLAEALNAAFGLRDLNLRTDDGQILGVCFSGKRLGRTTDIAHADIRSGLPDAEAWRRRRRHRARPPGSR